MRCVRPSARFIPPELWNFVAAERKGAKRSCKKGHRHAAFGVLDSFVVLENTSNSTPPAPESRRLSNPPLVEAYADPLYRHLGVNGIDRVKEFKTYKDGWDSGKGAALNEKSEENLHSFLRSRAEGFPTQPSVFLTRAGNLRLSWENEDGDGIDLEFFPDGIEYFLESSGEEGVAQLNSIDEILAAV